MRYCSNGRCPVKFYPADHEGGQCPACRYTGLISGVMVKDDDPQPVPDEED